MNNILDTIQEHINQLIVDIDVVRNTPITLGNKEELSERLTQLEDKHSKLLKIGRDLVSLQEESKKAVSDITQVKE